MLSSIGEKKVIDKVRSLFKKSDHPSLEEIPKDTIEEKVERMLHSDLDSTEVSEKPSLHSCSTKGLFPQKKAEDLNLLCKRIIMDGKIHKARIEEALKSSAKGRALLEEFEIDQLRNRLKYERLNFVKAQKIRK